MKIKLLAAVTTGFLFAGCGPKQETSETENVFGTDNRTPMTSTTGPFRKIGLVRHGNSICSGSLVWHNLVLTNAHCTLQNGAPVSNLVFKAGEGTTDVTTASVTQVWRGTLTPSTQRSQDWAILKLSQSLTSRGYLGYKSQQNLNPFTNTLTMVGYSGDFYQATGKAGVHANCNVRGDENNYYLHDCDTKGGSSGGPIFSTVNGQTFIVAINAAHRFCNSATQEECANGVAYQANRANIAVKTNAFSAKITELRNQFPQP